MGKQNKKYNRYDLTGQYGICYINNEEKVLFDLEDYDKIKNYCWRVNCKGYAYASDINNKNKFVFMHNIIMNNEEKQYVVDHISHDGDWNNSSLDNRKCNLRVTSQSRNCVNKKKQSNNASGVVGVTKRKDNGKWVASIDMDKKHYYLGQFDNFDEAIKARKEAEERLHKEFIPKTYGFRSHRSNR